MGQQRKFLPVVLGSDLNAYGMARSFHEVYGISCDCFDVTRQTAARFSRIMNLHVVPDFDKEAVFLETLLHYAQQNYRSEDTKYLLIACTDRYAEWVSKYKEQLSAYFICPYVNYPIFKRLSNKATFYEICKDYQLPYPKTFVLHKRMLHHGRYVKPLPFSYPIVMKPSDSVAYLKVQFKGRKRAFILPDRDAFETILSRIYQAGYEGEMILQEFIPGDDSNMRILNAYVDEHRQVRMLSLGHPLLEDPHPAAIGDFVTILPDENEAVYQMIKGFLESIQYTGYANFDMKYDPRDGEYKLFEINLRQGRSSFFTNLNGYNLATLLVDDRVYNKPFTGTIYETKPTLDQKLWLDIPKDIFLKYVEASPAKTTAQKLIEKGAYGTTIIYEADASLLRKILVKWLNIKLRWRFKKYFTNKDELSGSDK